MERGMEISQDQLLNEGEHADLQRQFRFDDHILAICCTATLDAWDRDEESGKRTDSLLKLYKAPKTLH